MSIARAIVRLDEEGRLMRRYTSIPIAACLLDRRDGEVKEWVRNPQLIRLNSRWMYEKDYLRVKDEDGVVKELAFKKPEPPVHNTQQPETSAPKTKKKTSENTEPDLKHGRWHTGTIYTELHNRGRLRNNGSGNSFSTRMVKGVGMVTCYKYRWVAEITYHRKRYRCRSVHFHVVKAWLDEMRNRFSN